MQEPEEGNRYRVKTPAGTTFLLNTYAANYDPDHFEHPEKFIPERHIGDSTAAKADMWCWFTHVRRVPTC